ncbi:MAG TPA: DNA repair protein RecN, partial [Gammaproteobacteria bacterium]|nr:DNA repair protein RecN [Gammaproteobacteria bacterium]
MLTHILIRNFAIIENLELEFKPGMTVLTGETGAGKSILVDALGLVLGDRAEAGVVRHGAEKAEVGAEFDLKDAPEALAWLEENDLAEDGACILRRVVGSDGRSRFQINGRSVPLQSLKEIGERLLDIHGQHEHQSLMRPAAQMSLLDAYGDHGSLLSRLGKLHSDWKAAHDKLISLRTAAGDRDKRLEMLRFEVGELEALKLKAGEVQSIDAEHKRLAHGGKLMETAQGALDALYEAEEDSAHQRVSRTLASLDAQSELEPRFKALRDMLAGAQVQLTETADGLRDYLADVDLDPKRLEWLENRLAAIHDVARKHRIEPDALLAHLEALQTELKQLENSEITLQELEAELAKLKAAYKKAAEELHARREKTAADLGKKVTAAMQELGMAGGKFEIAVTVPDAERFTAKGIDQVEFTVTANKGQPLKPLAKVASGGELSRISLAIQVIAAQAAAIPSMVFDEVDAGIGGGTAEIVGRRLRDLAAKRQVLCVTHLPQVASQGHQHFRVLKETKGNTTLTRIESLDKKSQVEELARMLGGVEITETTRKHAREMISRVTD